MACAGCRLCSNQQHSTEADVDTQYTHPYLMLTADKGCEVSADMKSVLSFSGRQIQPCLLARTCHPSFCGFIQPWHRKKGPVGLNISFLLILALAENIWQVFCGHNPPAPLCCSTFPYKQIHLTGSSTPLVYDFCQEAVLQQEIINQTQSVWAQVKTAWNKEVVQIKAALYLMPKGNRYCSVQSENS